MTPAKSTRHKEQPGYVLHSYPYQETSLIVEIFTREFGRVGMVAKGAKRPHSPLRSVLMPFHALTLDWSGKSELKTLRTAEWRGAFRLLKGRALICGFYLNELLLKLLHRDDPHDGRRVFIEMAPTTSTATCSTRSAWESAPSRRRWCATCCPLA